MNFLLKPGLKAAERFYDQSDKYISGTFYWFAIIHINDILFDRVRDGYG